MSQSQQDPDPNPLHVVYYSETCTCGQDAVTCQACGKRVCGTQARWVGQQIISQLTGQPRMGMGNICNTCFAKTQNKTHYTPPPWLCEKPRWTSPVDERHIYDSKGQVIARIPLAGPYQSVNESIANGELMADAGNTLGKTGCTPSQLAEHRDVLINAVRILFDEMSNRVSDKACEEFSDEARALLVSAIQANKKYGTAY